MQTVWSGLPGWPECTLQAGYASAGHSVAQLLSVLFNPECCPVYCRVYEREWFPTLSPYRIGK